MTHCQSDSTMHQSIAHDGYGDDIGARWVGADGISSLPTPGPLPQVAGGYGTILADPPWRFSNRTGKVAPEHRRLRRYPTMPVEQIVALPVAEIAAARAHLYLWVPNAMVADGLAVMRA